MSDGAFDFTGICRDAIQIFGIRNQACKAIEELAELQVEIAHYLDGRLNSSRLLQELADVEIMCRQLRIGFDSYGMVDQHKILKLERLAARIDHEKARKPNASLMTECVR